MKLNKLILMIAVAATVVSCGSKSGGMPNFGDNEYPVVTIGSQSTTLQTTYPATIKGIHDVEVRPKTSGIITRVLVQEGQRVSAGQVLFTIDNGTQVAAVRQAAAAVGTARAQLNTARLTYNNNRKLFAKNVIGQYELSTAANNLANAEAQVAQAAASLASAKEQLSYCVVKAPANGVVGDLPYKAGAYASPSAALTTVSDISTVEVFFSVNEGKMMDLIKNAGSVQAAIAQMPAVQLQMADGTDYSLPGKVVKVSGVIDQNTGAYTLIAHFSNPQGLLKSGGAGQIIIPHFDSNAIIIPQEAVVQVQDKMFVYVAQSKGNKTTVKYTEITVNPQNDGQHYIVTSGLHVGDRIVTKGISKLTDGMEIKPITEAQYQQNIDNAAKLAQKQGTAKGFVSAMSGK